MASLKEWIRDFWRMRKWDRFIAILTIVSFILGLLGGFVTTNIYINSQINTINNSTIGGPVCVGDCANADLTFTKIENKMMHYTHQFQILEGKFGQERWEEMYNVKIILPNGNAAFLPKMEEGKKYILGSSNEDCSDISISPTYQIPENFDESNICWLRRLPCGDDWGNMEEEIEELKKEGKIPAGYEYLYHSSYLPINKAYNNFDSCITFKEE